MKPASLLFVLCALCLGACGGSAATTSSSSAAPVSQPGAPVIAALKTHDGKVSLVGGGKDLRVVVTKDDGTVVANNATLDELRTKDPESWMLVKSAVAQGNGTYIDATFVDAPAPALK